MSPAAWLSLGFAAGVTALLALQCGLNQLDARAARYVRPAGSPTVARIGRKP